MSPNQRGILLMVVAMAAFAVEDALIKLAAASVPTGQILLMIGLGGALAFATFAAIQGQRVLTRAALAPSLLLRNGFEMLGTMGFVTALSLIPISTASAILQATPIAVTAAAAIFLGETVGWRRWSAVGAGFCGVILILQPGAEVFDPNVLWAVLGVIGLAGRDIATRRMPPGLPTVVVATWGFAAVAVLGAGMLALSGGAGLPEPRALAFIGTALVIGIAAYWAIIEATRAGEVSAITPFRYTRLVFALGIGLWIFDERPNALMLAGAAIVVGSGLYTLYRERRHRLDTRQTSPAPEART